MGFTPFILNQTKWHVANANCSTTYFFLTAILFVIPPKAFVVTKRPTPRNCGLSRSCSASPNMLTPYITMARKKPSQNSGTQIQKIEKLRRLWSIPVSGHILEIIPTCNPMISEKLIAISPIWREMGSRKRISSVTECQIQNDYPKSSWIASP